MCRDISSTQLTLHEYMSGTKMVTKEMLSLSLRNSVEGMGDKDLRQMWKGAHTLTKD